MSDIRVTCTAAPGVYLISDGATVIATVHRASRDAAEAMADAAKPFFAERVSA